MKKIIIGEIKDYLIGAVIYAAAQGCLYGIKTIQYSDVEKNQGIESAVSLAQQDLEEVKDNIVLEVLAEGGIRAAKKYISEHQDES